MPAGHLRGRQLLDLVREILECPTPSAMQMRFIEPNRLMATGTSKPVGRSNSSPGPPPGDFDTLSVTARDLEVGAHRLGDAGQFALFLEGGMN